MCQLTTEQTKLECFSLTYLTTGKPGAYPRWAMASFPNVDRGLQGTNTLAYFVREESTKKYETTIRGSFFAEVFKGAEIICLSGKAGALYSL